MIEHGLDKVLFDKTVALAKKTGAFGTAKLRAAFDSCPLYGAGRVEDTFNLIGRAAFHVVRTAAERLGKSVEQVAAAAGIPAVVASSIKSGLDIDWDDPEARQEGLGALLAQVELFLLQLRAARRTPEGRLRARDRIHVEHGLARLATRSGRRARDRGLRKNLFDERRHAALVNLRALATTAV